MQFLCIGVNEYADDITRHISNELQRLNASKINYSVENEVNSSGSTSIVCRIKDDPWADKKSVHPYDILRIHVSNALADYIINKYEEKLLNRVININYCYFSPNERKEILSLAQRIIRSGDKCFFDSLFQVRRRNVIVRKLLDYFDASNNIILDGFVNFRLKDYMKDLEEIVDEAVDDFLMQREYKEFIRLLRYFVEVQEPKFNIVHVMMDCEGKYLLLDETQKEITHECIQEFVTEVSEGEINCDDLLVSSLITLAPKKIVLHGILQFRNKELLETIKNVFSGKIIICGECDLCGVDHMKSLNKN